MIKLLAVCTLLFFAGCESAQILYRCNGDKICRCESCESTDCAFTKNCCCPSSLK